MQTVPPTTAPAPAPAGDRRADPVIRVKDLSFRYPGTDRDTLRNVDLTVERGDFVAVVGGNGSAKTTLCKTFNGLVPHYWSGDFAGSVHVDGVDTWDSSVAELSSRVGYVYQDFQNQLVRPTVRDEVAFGPLNFGHADYRERTDEALEHLGIAHLRDQFVWQLSGGQSHLVALAAVLALRPEVIVVDEPVAELDPARAREIYLRLRELNERDGITVITIEHHAEFIAEFARSVVLMADGAPVWHLPVQEAMDRHEDLAAHGVPAPDAVALSAAAGARPVALDVPSAAAALRPVVRERPTGERPTGADAPEGADPAPVVDTADQTAGAEHAPAAPAAPVASAEIVATLRGVRHGYRSVAGGLSTVLDNLDLDLRAGERIALVGTNGAGKTTLMKLLTGLIVPRAGTVTVDGIDTRTRSAATMADHVSYLYQHPQQMFLKDTVREDIALFPRGRKVPDAEAIVERIIEEVGLSALADRDGRSLSGGQQRRATLGIGLAMRPSLLLLDEPTSSLDIRSRDDVTAMLAALAETVRCAVVATHDMELVATWASRVLVLDQGKVLADVTPRELFSRPELTARTRLVPPQAARIALELGLDPLPLTAAELRAWLPKEVR
ncbi:MULTISPECIES: ABC transporter ATP-binding protein [Brachybacterium]|uniref:ABC transporter ATP-binding protein n=2 Tax=Brachybacterium TaxID=43668 RepID=A0A3R8SPH8_9MICO|nr:MULTISPECIES: ABC transporter ATP-binding protein [Brachybacterium]RRR18373.1 ABC transporter ATP-binding protein [Brachybacterium paraconglomeratum]GLI30000.1 energy-coupling factor ABC transporter ATP-binding protein [Brachybacterium conglomeratum]GLK04538.1 energy-coupling factor ABC transporter ATP-binding protein [Brachybacterium conglomeratum]